MCLAPNDSAEPQRNLCREITRGDGADGTANRDEEHDATESEDVSRIAADDPGVHDIGHQRREKEVRERLDENEDDHDCNRDTIRPQEAE